MTGFDWCMVWAGPTFIAILVIGLMLWISRTNTRIKKLEQRIAEDS